MSLIFPTHDHSVVVRAGSAEELSTATGKIKLLVITPGVKRFEYFRKLTRIARGQEAPETLRDVQELYDTHFLNSPEWEAARK